MSSRYVVLWCFVSVLLAGAGIASATTYTITDLGTLGGSSSCAISVNDNGWVTGWSNPTGSSSIQHAFIAKPSGGTYSMTDVFTAVGMSDSTSGACGV